MHTKTSGMRFLLLALAVFSVLFCSSQPAKTITLSGIIVSPDSVPIPEVAIINIKTGKTARTNANGFFQTNISEGDSLFVYHIAYKKLFIHETDNIRSIVLEPEIHELKQVEINDELQQKNLEQTISDIKRLAPMKKLSGYDRKSRLSSFVEGNGSHDRGFSPFFGPTIPIPVRKITDLVTEISKRHQRKKLSSHYHIVKKKNRNVLNTSNH